MEHETFYATAAQILPAIAIAGVIELRLLIKRLDRRGAFDRPVGMWFLWAHIYTRILALATFLAVILAISCLWALKTGCPPFYLDEALYWVVGLAPVTIALPILGAVVKPQDLLGWYGDSKAE